MSNKLEISLQKTILNQEDLSKIINSIEDVQKYLVYFVNELWQIVSELYYTLQTLKDFFKDIETKKKKLSQLLNELIEKQSIEKYIKDIDLSQSLLITNCLEVLQQIPIIHWTLQIIKDFFIENVKIIAILN